jgi:CubicO group peptidase (beta-lactamase class C family)
VFIRFVGIYFVLVLMRLSIPASHGQELPTAKPAEVGLSAEKLARVGSAVQALVADQKVAGAITMVARQGKIVYFEATGKRDIDADLPMERDTILRFYSMSKPVTSCAIMMLVEDGKIGLDDPVSKHLPEFKDTKVYVRVNGDGFETESAKREPTVRDLLRHTAGLTYGLFGNTPIDAKYNSVGVLTPTSTLTDMTKKLGALPLLYQPGTKWNYSVATDVLGRIVEVASSKSLDEFFAERIFRPLDMRDTGFFVPADKLARFAATHGISDAKLTVTDSPATSAFRNRPTLLSGGGGLVSTARDYMRFCQMVAAGGELNGKRLLRAETVQEMTKNQLPDEAFPIAFGPIQRPGVGFGLGFSVQVNRDPLSANRVGEFGWGGAASTHFWISPKDELVVIALQQFMPFSMRLEQAIKPIVYDAIE